MRFVKSPHKIFLIILINCLFPITNAFAMTPPNPPPLPAIVYSANTSQPDGGINACQITSIHVNRNLVTSYNDTAYYFEYYLPYATPPTTLVSQTFMFQLMDAAKTNVLATIVPYPFFGTGSTGYNKGNALIYSSNSTGLTWGASYYIRISENPPAFLTPVSLDIAIPTSAYSSFSSQADNQAEMATNVIAMAKNLQDYWGGDPLLSQSAAGATILSIPRGENYYRGAMYGLQVMAPTLFLVQAITLDVTSTNWTITQFDTYSINATGSAIDQGITSTATQFGFTPAGIMGYFFIGILCLGAIIASAKKFNKTTPGYVACAVLLTMGVGMGWFPTAVYAIIFQLMGLYIAYLWMGARA